MAKLLVATVGGTPDPILITCRALKPDKVIFISSKTSRPVVDTIVKTLKAEWPAFGPANYEDHHELPDPQDFGLCVRTIRRLTPTVMQWAQRGSDYEVYVDITGGTKSASAALGLVAHRWPCRFVYVGGEKRDKDGLGNVLPGEGRPFFFANPWDELGYQVHDDAVLLFNGHNYAAANELLMRSLTHGRIGSSTRRETLTLARLAEAYSAWDRFQHSRAAKLLREVLEHVNDLRQLFGQAEGDELERTLREHMKLLQSLQANEATRELFLDLLSNAQRRSSEGRYDDAVARLYRAIEALAQYRLQSRYGIKTNNVERHHVPDELAAEWWTADDAEPLKIGLRQAYQLLAALGDDLGVRFQAIFLDDPDNDGALGARNASILAHGFQPVAEAVFQRLWKATLELAEVDEKSLLKFPQLRLAY